MLLQATRYENYNSVTTSLVTVWCIFSTYHTPPPFNCVLHVDNPLSWSLNFQAFHFVIMPVMCFQGLLNTTSLRPNFLNHAVNKLRRQTHLPVIPAALTSPQSCRKCQSPCWFWISAETGPYNLMHETCILIYVITFPACVSSTQRLYFSTFVFFHVAFTVTSTHHTSVQIITFVAMCYSSPITLLNNIVIK